MAKTKSAKSQPRKAEAPKAVVIIPEKAPAPDARQKALDDAMRETEQAAEAISVAFANPPAAVNALRAAAGAELLLALPEGLEIWRIAPLALQEQDKNARVQAPTTFKSLTRNVKKRGALESLPFCGKKADGGFYIISGHHRVRAAIAAELKTIVILVDARVQTRDEIRAKQLAHNAINGTDDPSVLLQLLDEITDVDALLEASIDRGQLEKLAAAPANAQDVAVDYDFQLVTVAFLPKQIKDAVLEALQSSERVYTAPVDAHEALVVAMKKLGKTDNIRSMGAIAYRMVEILNDYLAAKAAEPPAAAAN